MELPADIIISSCTPIGTKAIQLAPGIARHDLGQLLQLNFNGHLSQAGYWFSGPDWCRWPRHPADLFDPMRLVPTVARHDFWMGMQLVADRRAAPRFIADSKGLEPSRLAINLLLNLGITQVTGN